MDDHNKTTSSGGLETHSGKENGKRILASQTILNYTLKNGKVTTTTVGKMSLN